jgi:hypothetical protein
VDRGAAGGVGGPAEAGSGGGLMALRPHVLKVEDADAVLGVLRQVLGRERQ